MTGLMPSEADGVAPKKKKKRLLSAEVGSVLFVSICIGIGIGLSQFIWPRTAGEDDDDGSMATVRQDYILSDPAHHFGNVTVSSLGEQDLFRLRLSVAIGIPFDSLRLDVNRVATSASRALPLQDPSSVGDGLRDPHVTVSARVSQESVSKVMTAMQTLQKNIAAASKMLGVTVVTAGEGYMSENDKNQSTPSPAQTQTPSKQSAPTSDLTPAQTPSKQSVPTSDLTPTQTPSKQSVPTSDLTPTQTANTTPHPSSPTLSPTETPTETKQPTGVPTSTPPDVTTEVNVTSFNRSDNVNQSKTIDLYIHKVADIGRHKDAAQYPITPAS